MSGNVKFGNVSKKSESASNFINRKQEVVYMPLGSGHQSSDADPGRPTCGC